MPTEDRRQLLEAVAYSDDPSVSTGDRLRALELLDRLPDADENTRKLVAMIQGLDQEETERDLAAMLAGMAKGFQPPPAHEPIKREVSAIDAEIERRVDQQVAERLKARGEVPDEEVTDAEVVPEPHQMAQLPPGIEPNTPGFLTGSRDRPPSPADARAERRRERQGSRFRV